ncbi:MAG TPA: alanine--tRNA ligase [Candidatus Eisenbacteria bacterium]|nr:alanine--tRNA ligase [Candidatus Eisenbacteria bacterium]
MTTSPSTSTPRTAAELRRAFLAFFEQRGHTVVPSAPLVPNDPTLLFTTAGMVQFKPYYTAADVPYTRATSVQKCLRLTDLDNVGLTPRHDTFFEMLGNFSFGPRERGAYFKEEAIAFAWEFVTRVLELPVARLYASIFAGEQGVPRDDEAERLWRKVGMAADHIVPLGRADNFWGPAGGQGACGPCSEIYFDLGEERPSDAGAFWGERPGDEGDRFMEFWNLVFPQFDARKDGTLAPLGRPGIDTGMGLERLALIVEGRRTIFETDVFAPLVDEVLAIAGGRAAERPVAVRDARIVADHVRGLTFAIAEGALPGNEGAGYVLRRLLRRAVTRGRSRHGLAIPHTFLARVATRAVAVFGGHYRELEQHQERILRVLEQEEAHFAQTFEAGLARLEELLAGNVTRLSGEDAFVLHDTYGFPVELTEEIAGARAVTVDREGFETAMDRQRERARAASRFAKAEGGERAEWVGATAGADSEFLGYGQLCEDDAVLRRWRPHGADELELVFDRTPAYAESGGQVSDRGTIEGQQVRAALTHVYKDGDSIVHRVRVRHGTPAALIEAAQSGGVRITIDPTHRLPTMRHHTATHLLHAALRFALGDHVRQAGSLVAPDRLRFDYTHFEAPTPAQLEQVESLVNDWILANREVGWRIMPLADARALGAMALFGEKYGAQVRMVTVAGSQPDDPVSRELCGGTHVQRTGDIGAFVLVSEAAIASGVRRIEAVCGTAALDHVRAEREQLQRAAQALQAPPAQVAAHIEKLKAELEKLRKAQADLARGGLAAEMERLAQSAERSGRGRYVVAELHTPADANAVRDAADVLRGKLGRGAALLALQGQGKLTFLAAVSDELLAEKKLRADELVRAVAQVTGGSGGGKPHLALAGGKDASKLAEALAEGRRRIVAALE